MNPRRAITGLAAGLSLLMLPLVILVLAIGGAQDASSCAAGLSGLDVSGGSATGQAIMVQANIPNRSGVGGLRSSLARVRAQRPDFITLNESSARSLAQIRSAAPGYDVYRVASVPPGSAAALARDTAVLWRTDAWTRVAGGRQQIVWNDITNYAGHKVNWDRFITWATFQRTTDHSTVSVISVHQMTNPGRFGPNMGKRQAQYAKGMDILIGVIEKLRAAGPVLVGGDMNVHPGKGAGPFHQGDDAWAAPMKMASAGYKFYAESVDFLFYPATQGVRLLRSWNGTMASDHHWIAALFSLGGGSSAGAGHRRQAPAAVAPAAGSVQLRPVAAATTLPHVAGFDDEQVRNALAVIAAGRSLGVPPRGLAIGLMTAYGESGLHNVDHGDSAGPDSRGIFQQRANGAWGTLAQRMNPYQASLSFFKALLKVPGWQSMSPTMAAHTVQRNSDPNYYTQFWHVGLRLLDQLAGVDYRLAAASLDGCDATGLQNVNFGSGEEGTVGPFPQAVLIQRVKKIMAAGTYDPFFHAVSGGWYRKCQQFVAIVSGRPHSGYGSAADGWAHMVATGAAHKVTDPDGKNPPVGAWLYYAPNHVDIYLGGGQVASNDVFGNGRIGIGPASAITDGPWHLRYLGWSTPWGL